MKEKKEIECCLTCGSVCVREYRENGTSGFIPLNAALIKSMSWMIDHFRWAHDNTGVPGNYSDELKQAMMLLETLKKGQEQFLLMHKGKGFEEHLQKGEDVCRP